MGGEVVYRVSLSVRRFGPNIYNHGRRCYSELSVEQSVRLEDTAVIAYTIRA